MKLSSCQPAKKKRNIFLYISPWRRQLDTFVMSIHLNTKINCKGQLRLAEVILSWFLIWEAAFQLSGLIQLNWREKKKTPNQTFSFKNRPLCPSTSGTYCLNFICYFEQFIFENCLWDRDAGICPEMSVSHLYSGKFWFHQNPLSFVARTLSFTKYYTFYE